jgi:hypothetical protein
MFIVTFHRSREVRLSALETELTRFSAFNQKRIHKLDFDR